MRTPQTDERAETKQPANTASVALGLAIMPVVLIGAGLALSSATVLRVLRKQQESRLRSEMSSAGRLITWAAFSENMRRLGGTCIEERFSPKGPVRFWWTQEDVHAESPHQIIDWFTMHKGGPSADAVVRWCRERYTGAGGRAFLVDTRGIGSREIYAMWSECRSHSCPARWVEVAPPEILPALKENSPARNQLKK